MFWMSTCGNFEGGRRNPYSLPSSGSSIVYASLFKTRYLYRKVKMFKSSPGPSGRIHKVVTGSSGYIIDLCCASYLSYYGNMLNLGKVGQLIESWINIKMWQNEDKARPFFPQILPHTLVLGLHAQSYNQPLSAFKILFDRNRSSILSLRWHNFGYVWYWSSYARLIACHLSEGLLCNLKMWKEEIIGEFLYS